MRAVIQRVSNAKVEVDGKIVNQIEKGLLIYLSVGRPDTINDAQFMAEKIVNLRIFEDQAGKMNLSVLDTKGDILLISNFTLHGDCRKGRRPSFEPAAEPTLANELYEKTAELIAGRGVAIKKGIFDAHMLVTSTNNGPVTFILDSTRLFQ